MYTKRWKAWHVAPRVGAWIETAALRIAQYAILSHPVWVRGLKRSISNMFFRASQSHPVWVRGLKPTVKDVNIHFPNVAPRVGAWIETVPIDYDKLLSGVAPRVGAWIETTKSNRLKMPSVASHPVWVRGLKLD